MTAARKARQTGPTITVSGADDSRLADYRWLRDPARRIPLEDRGGFFVVEGIVAIERLLGSGWPVRSLLLLPRVADRLRSTLDAGSAGFPVFVAPLDVLREVVGFDLHRGAVAAVDRPPPEPPDRVVAGARFVLVVEGVNDHENLGALFRNAAAFGVDGLLLDPRSADPLYRRSVRVSMGHVLDVPFARTGPLPAGLEVVRAAGGFVAALTPAPGAVPLGELRPPRHGPVALVVGAEGPGLSAATLAAADVRIRIPMAPGVDSLNVATAAAVALSHLGP